MIFKQEKEKKEKKEESSDENDLQATRQVHLHVQEDPEQTKYFKRMGKVSMMKLEDIKKKIQGHSIIITDIYASQLQKIITGKEGSSFLFLVHIGNFHFEISFLKVEFSSLLLERKKVNEGAYAQIYSAQKNGKKYAIKARKIIGEEDSHDILDQVVKEYAILKLASLFEFGPRLFNFYGYDIISFSDSIQFTMEFCGDQSDEETDQRIETDLINILKIMHSLKIVHCDIKNSNIAWSSFLKKWVFIDFGFSQILKERPGQKTLTKFIGTYKFASKEMKALYHLKSPEKIDLYGNDLFGVQAILEKIKQSNHSNHSELLTDLFTGNNFLAGLNGSLSKIICLKKQIFTKQFFKADEIISSQIKLRKKMLLLLIESRETLLKNQKTSESVQLFGIYKKYSFLSEQEKKIIEKFQSSILYERIITLSNLLIKNTENYSITQFFKKEEEELRNYISQNLGSFSFTMELFFFIDEAFFSSSQKVYLTLKSVIGIIAEYKNLQNQRKSWFWYFRDILMEMREVFIEKKNFLVYHLKFYFYCFHDLENMEKINDYFLVHKFYPNQTKLFASILQFLYNAVRYPSQVLLQSCYSQFLREKQKQVTNKSIAQNCERLLNIILKTNKTHILKKQDEEFFHQLIQSLSTCKVFQENESLKLILIQNFYSWREDFFMRHGIEKQTTFKVQLSVQEKKNKYVLFKRKILQFSQNDSPKRPKQMKMLYRLYPIFQQLPLLCNYFYNNSTSNQQRADQISHDMIQMWRNSLESVIKILTVVTCRNSQDDKRKFQQISKIFHQFLLSYKFRIEKRKISQYWDIFFFCMSLLYSLNKKIEENFCKTIHQSIIFIIALLKSKQTTENEKNYIALFQSLQFFFSNNKADSINLLLSNYKKKNFIGEALLEQNYILALSFYFKQVKEKNSLKDQFYKQIQEKENACWIFYALPTVFKEYSLSKCSSIFDIISFYNYFKRQAEFYQKQNLSYKNIFQLTLLKQFFGKLNHNELTKLAVIIYQNQQLCSPRELGDVSAFIGMMTLQESRGLKKNSKVIKRLLILSLIGIDRFENQNRLQIRTKLIKLLNQISLLPKKPSSRKRLILSRRFSYGSENYREFTDKSQSKFDKFKKKVTSQKTISILSKKLARIK